MLRGLENEPVVRNPRLRSVDEAVTPFAQLMMPPPEVPVTAPVPLVPYATVVANVAVDQSGLVAATLNPDGKVAVALLPIALKFSVTGELEVIDT